MQACFSDDFSWYSVKYCAMYIAIKESFVNIQRIFVAIAIMITTATAVADAPAGGESTASNSIASIVMLVAFGLIFYFMVFRPQNKRMREHRDLVTKLQKGDEVLTSGGLIGKVAKISDDFFLITIAEGIDVMVQKQAISSSLPKGTIKSITT